jgi:hypothetical protein
MLHERPDIPQPGFAFHSTLQEYLREIPGKLLVAGNLHRNGYGIRGFFLSASKKANGRDAHDSKPDYPMFDFLIEDDLRHICKKAWIGLSCHRK